MDYVLFLPHASGPSEAKEAHPMVCREQLHWGKADKREPETRKLQVW